MAARSNALLPEVWQLRDIHVEDLEPVLEEEVRTWREKLSWDFQPSADLVRRFVGMQALLGRAVSVGEEIVGYSYYVCEDVKGLIGDLYVLEEYATEEVESRLLEAVIQDIVETPFVRRIESQLMMLRSGLRTPLPLARHSRVYGRSFMMAELGGTTGLPPGKLSRDIRFADWRGSDQEDAARVIAAAYHDHIDSDINDQYRSVTGARRFLMNIVQYPGCGTFFQPGSKLAFDARSSRLCGLCLSSLVASDTGHITQVCVLPAVKGQGVGYELLRRSMASLTNHGCNRVSLTVTSVNDHAIRLYERIGFSTRSQFSAYVWDGF